MKFWLTDGVFHREKTMDWDRGERRIVYPDTGVPLVIRKGAKSVTVPEGTERIGVLCFSDCHEFEEVILPEGLKELDNRAFQGTALHSIRIPESVKRIGDSCFEKCRQLEEVTLPEGLEELGYGAFSGTALHSIRIPEGVKGIDRFCFYDCNYLEEVKLPEGLEELGYGAFSGTALHSIRIPEGVKKIEGSCFKNCQQLEEVNLPDGSEELGDQAFSGAGLRSICIPEGVKKVGDSCFSNCTQLEEVRFPRSLTQIPSNAFVGCSSLRHLPIPPSVHEPFSLYGCTSLREFTIPEGATMLPENAFRGWSELREFDVPDTITSIGNAAFAECKSLKRIHLPEALMHIGDSVFEGCTELEQLNIPGRLKEIHSSCWSTQREDKEERRQLKELSLEEGLERIGDYTFENSTALQELVLPSTMWEVGLFAFCGCTALRRLVVKGTLHHFSSGAFSRCTALREVWLSEEGIEDAKLAKRIFGANAKLYTLEGKPIDAKQITGYVPTMAQNPRDREVLALVKKSIDLPELMQWAAENIHPRKLLRSVQYADSPDRAPAEAVAFLLYIYSSQTRSFSKLRSDAKNFYNLSLSPEADAIAAMLDHAQLMDVLTQLCCPGYHNLAQQPSRLSPTRAIQMGRDGFEAYGHYKRPELLLPYCRYADVEEIIALIQLTHPQPDTDWFTWENKGAALYYRNALMLSDTNEARDYMDRLHNLDLYADMRDTTPEQMCLEATKKRGLRPDGSMRFDLGNEALRLEARLNDDLQLLLFDGNTGKQLRSFPKKGIDPQKREEAQAEYRAMKSDIRRVFRKYISALREQYNYGTAVSRSEWEECYRKETILSRIARLLVWQQGKGKAKTYFTLREGETVRVDGTAYALGEDKIRLAHPVEMNAEEIEQWQQYFLDRQLRQPFAQVLWEPVIRWQTRDFSTYYAGVVLRLDERKALKSALCRRGIPSYKRSSFDKYNTMYLGNAMEMDIVVDQHDRSVKLGSVRLYNWASHRAINSVLIELDKVTLAAQVANDNVDALTDEALRDFTAAQLAEFIDLSIKKEATSCTARLLDYKNSRFPQYSDLEQFTLDW